MQPQDTSAPTSPQPPVQQPQKKSRTGLLLVILLILALLGVAATYLLLTNKSTTDKKVLNDQLTAAQQNSAKLEAQVAELKKSPADTTTATKTDKELVTDAMTTQCALLAGSPTVSQAGTITIDGNFADVGFLCKGQTESGQTIFKKANGTWVKVTSYIGGADSDSCVKYSLPAKYCAD